MALTDNPHTPAKNENLLTHLAQFSARRPFAVLGASILLVCLSLYHTIGSLEFLTSRNALISIKEPAVKRHKEISEEFGRQTNTVVVVEGLDLDRMKAFIRSLAIRLEKEPQYFQNLFYRIDTSSLEGKKLLYLSVDELRDLKNKLIDYDELIEELIFTPQTERILAFINQKISEATVSHIISNLIGEGEDKDTSADATDINEEKEPVDLSFLRSLLQEMGSALLPSYRFQSPWDTFFDTDAKLSEDGFLISEDKRFAFIILELKKQKGIFIKQKPALKRLRIHIQDLLETHPDLKAGVTGEDSLSTDEMNQALGDTTMASIVALTGIGFLFMLVFRQIYNPLIVLFSLSIAICWTFGWLTLTVGHLTILTVAFTPILLGLGVDFGIHLLARYNEERDQSVPFNQALGNSFHYTGKAVAAGAVTTALAFYAIMLADFRGIQELGFIAGSGVLLSLLATFTVLPALLTLVEMKRRADKQRFHQMRPSLYFLEIILRFRTSIWITALLITGVSVTAIGRVYFDYNLLNLQAKGTESVEWEKKVIEHSERSSWYALTTASSLEQVLEKEKIFETLPSVRKVDSLSDLIPEHQQDRIRSIAALKPLVKNFEFEMEESEPLDPDHLIELLDKIKFKLRTDVEWDPRKKPSEEEILYTREALLNLIELMKESDSETIKRKLMPFQKKLFSDFEKKFRLIKDNVQPSGPITEKDVPSAFLNQFKGKNGQYLLRVFSKENIWEKLPMTEFVGQLQTVEPDITGSPIIGKISINLMRKGYLQGSLYAFLCIFIVVWLMFRKIKDTLFTLIPLVITTIWLLGWMGWTGLPFNLANVIALPLILGIVVDDGIHVIHRYKENPDSARILVSGSTAHAISLTSWTTMIGFGSLLISKHFGIFSLGLLVTLGVGIAWCLSLILLPVILSLRKTTKKQPNRTGT